MKIICDRGSHLYSCKEYVRFKVSGEGKTHIELSRDGAEILRQWDAMLEKDQPFELDGTLTEPGFLRCRACGESGKSVLCGAGFDVHAIRPVYPEPEDFDAFWEKALAEDAAVAPDVRMEKVEALSNKVRTVYTVSRAAAGRRIYAWLSIPAGPGPFPGIVLVPGAGGGYNHPCLPWLRDNQLEDKVAMLVITVHPFQLPVQCDDLNQYISGIYGKHGYFDSGLTEDPREFFFYRFVPGAVRMAEWFAAQAFVDPGRIVYHGGSQGGFMGHFLAAYTNIFKAAHFFVPSAYSDVGGPSAGRHPSQSRMVPAAEFARSLRYYDTANTARRIKCPVQTYIGFIDDTCHPSGVYAAYNMLECEKNVINMVDHGHECDPLCGPVGMGFLRAKLNLSGDWM